MKEVKKMLNAKLECHLAGPHALFPHEVSSFIYIYLFIYFAFMYSYTLI